MIQLMLKGLVAPFQSTRWALGRGLRLPFVCLLLTLAVLAPAVGYAAEPQPVAEDQIKAAMIYKFLSYVDWPAPRTPTADAPFEIAFIGGRDVYEELQEITEDISITGHSITLRRVASPASLTEPHVVFVGEDAEHHLDTLIELAEQRSFLVITENDKGLVSGSTINLKLTNGRMGFGVSLGAAGKAKLHLSSRLLAIAQKIERAEP